MEDFAEYVTSSWARLLRSAWLLTGDWHLAALPKQQWAVVMLRFHADLTEAATAQTLGIGVGTVKSYTARALASLRADPGLRELIGVVAGPDEGAR